MRENRKGQTSLSFYIKKYGEIDGPKIYHEKKGKHNSYYCIEYWLKQGMEEELAKSKIRELFESRPNFSKVYCIKKYGESKGTHVWKLRNEIWQTTLNLKSDEEKARINKSKAITLENFIKKYGEIDGPLRFESRKIGGGCVSLESKKFFVKLYKNLRRLDIIKKEDVYFGLKGSKEYFIKTKNSIRFYDFTILPLKIIVEYNGILYHPKPGETNWKNPFGRTYEEAYQYDLEKIKLAEEKGFKVYSVWSDEDLTESLYNITMLITDIRDHIKGDKFE